MSIELMTLVWAKSKQKGSSLLALLAIADSFNDDGRGAFPSIATIAKKIRMSERNAQYLLRKLEESGELVVDIAGGPAGCNQYSINSALLEGGAKIAPPSRGAKFAPGVKPLAPGGCKGLHRGGAKACTHNHNRTKKETKRELTLSVVNGEDQMDSPFYQAFEDAYIKHYGIRPMNKRGDFVQLAGLRKHLGEILTYDEWHIAIRNYFATPRSKHTLADLATNYATFHRSRLDKYNKPVDQTRNGGAVIPG